MSNESANMDQVFRELEADHQPDLSAMDQHWQEMKELVTANGIPGTGKTGSSLLQPGLWIGTTLIAVTALVTFFIYRSKPKQIAAPSAYKEIARPAQKTPDTLPVIKSTEVKMPRTSRRGIAPGPAPITEKTLPPAAVSSSQQKESLVQSYPVKKNESPNPAIRNEQTDKPRDTIYVNPANKKVRTIPIKLTAYPVKVESSGRIQVDTVKSTIPVKPKNLILYAPTPFQKKWLRTLPHNLTSFLNP
ncbi:MAG: hypothetical protein KA821_06120 [Chitinophagaceae bacterium]|nr:hypothetical protein [Chitinophagaceae bacterium]